MLEYFMKEMSPSPSKEQKTNCHVNSHVTSIRYIRGMSLAQLASSPEYFKVTSSRHDLATLKCHTVTNYNTFITCFRSSTNLNNTIKNIGKGSFLRQLSKALNGLRLVHDNVRTTCTQ